jgi:hypothetical protein
MVPNGASGSLVCSEALFYGLYIKYGRRGIMQKSASLFIIMFVLVFSLWGCAGSFKGSGTIRPDRSVTKAFETFQINPNYNYYYTGSDVYPIALIGLDKKFKIEPDLWKKLEPVPKDFKDMISQMQSKALRMGQIQHGFSILDDQGRPIGVWYSILLAATSSLTVKDDGTVVIYQPSLTTYEKFDGDNRGSSR